MANVRQPHLNLTWYDTGSAARGYLVIDRLVTGIATGGTRMRPGCTLSEVADLAREMSHKTGIFGIPVGGAKGGIDYPADAADADEVRLRFVRAMRPFLDRCWVTAGDLGTPQSTLDTVFSRAGLGDSSLHAALLRSPDRVAAQRRVAESFAERRDGLSMPELIGGFGVAESALAGLRHLQLPPREARAVVQGFGAMGGSSALYLARAGVRVVGIADAAGLIVNPAGLDVPALLRARSPAGVVDRSALRPGDSELPGAEWLGLDVEVMIPAAASYVIDEGNCAQIRARLIAEAANVPVSAVAEQRLLARDVLVIPDFVANSGAVAWAWWVIFGQVRGAVDACDKLGGWIRSLTERILAEPGASPRAAAQQIAAANLDAMAAAFGDVEERVALFDAGAKALSLVAR